MEGIVTAIEGFKITNYHNAYLTYQTQVKRGNKNYSDFRRNLVQEVI